MQQNNNRRGSTVDDKAEAGRRSSASRPIQSPSLRRNSDVTPPSSRAGSITSQVSLVSQISQRPLEGAASHHFWDKLKRRSHRHSTTRPQAGPVKYSDIFAEPELKPVWIDWDVGDDVRARIANLRMRKIKQAEEAEYKAMSFMKDGCMDDLLADSNTGYKPVAGYMFDFDLRLDTGEAAYIALPRGLTLNTVYFPYGLAGARPRSSTGILIVDLSVSDPGFYLPKVNISNFYCRKDPTRSYPSSNTKDYVSFSLDAMIPSRSSKDTESRAQLVRWDQLQGLDKAFPEQLYKMSNETIDKWLGPMPKYKMHDLWTARQSQHFELRNVERNFAGDILKATLLKVDGPKIDKFLRGIKAQQEATETVSK